MSKSRQSLKDIVALFGTEAKAKLSNPAATGEPEDQLRAPIEKLLSGLVELCGFKRESLARSESLRLKDVLVGKIRAGPFLGFE